MKGLSAPIGMIFVLIIMIAILIPLMYYVNSMPAYEKQAQENAQPYEDQAQEQLLEVNGKDSPIGFYYDNQTGQAYFVYYGNPPIPINILYFLAGENKIRADPVKTTFQGYPALEYNVGDWENIAMVTSLGNIIYADPMPQIQNNTRPNIIVGISKYISSGVFGDAWDGYLTENEMNNLISSLSSLQFHDTNGVLIVPLEIEGTQYDGISTSTIIFESPNGNDLSSNITFYLGESYYNPTCILFWTPNPTYQPADAYYFIGISTHQCPHMAAIVTATPSYPGYGSPVQYQIHPYCISLNNPITGETEFAGDYADVSLTFYKISIYQQSSEWIMQIVYGNSIKNPITIDITNKPVYEIYVIVPNNDFLILG